MDSFCTFFCLSSPNTFTINFQIFSLSPNHHVIPYLRGRRLGSALPSSRGGPARLRLRLVSVSRLRGRRGRRVPSLASLLEVALVPGGLSEHLQPALLMLFQASPQLSTLPLSLHLPGEVGGRGEDKKRGLKKER